MRTFAQWVLLGSVLGCGRSPLAVGAFDPGGDASDDGDGGPVARVDVVLAIDDSTSMQEEIAALQGPVFDAFPQSLLAIHGGLVDFRLAVVDGCATPPLFHDWGDSGDCGFSPGTSWMVSDDPAFAQQYACVMELSTAGSQGQPDRCTGENDDEQPVSTAAAALALRDGPNVGFLRDDASLFVVAITDEDELPIPSTSPRALAEALVASKRDLDQVFLLGIGGEHDCLGPYGEAYEARTLRATTELFVAADRGVWWDLCEGGLPDAFAAAIDALAHD